MENKYINIAYAIKDFIKNLKYDLQPRSIKSKIQEKMDNMACLQTRLEYYGRQWRKNKYKNQSIFNFEHNLVKRAINSMDDCFEFINEPLFGFRVNITQERQCSELGPDCGMNSTKTNLQIYALRKYFQERQTGEGFRSEAPPDCRVQPCV